MSYHTECFQNAPIFILSQLHKCLYVRATLTTYSFGRRRLMESRGKWESSRVWEKTKKWRDGKWNNRRRGTEQVTHRREEQESVGCSQSIIQKRKVRSAMGAALNMPAWHHLLMGHRLTCYLSRLSPPCLSSSLSSLSLLLYTVLSVLCSGRTCK